jgi:hypothetical protein
MYDWFEKESWEKCFSLVDPKLRAASKVQLPVYSERMRAFKEVYGKIQPWLIRISLHLDMSSGHRDKRTCAYVYVIWQDKANMFHMFHDRWVKEDGRWFTRVAGLVPNREKN